MKKILLIATIMAAPAMSAEYTPIRYIGTSPSALEYNYVGTTTSGISVLSQVYDQSKMKITFVDTNTTPALSAIITQSERILPSIADWPSGYPGSFFANYPDLPNTPDNFVPLGVDAATTSAEYKAIADSILSMAESTLRGMNYIYDEIPGYIARGVSGSHVLISDQVASTSNQPGNMYYCDLQLWDMSQPFSNNIPFCTNIGYQKYPIDMNGSNTVQPGYQDVFNDSGIGLIKQQPDSYTGGEADLVLLTPNQPPIVFAQKQISAYSNGTTHISSGAEPYIFIQDINNTTRTYQFKNGELLEASGNINDFHSTSESITGTIIDITKDRILFYNEGQQYICEKDIVTQEDMSFTLYLRTLSENSDYEIFKNYPNKPDNYEELIVQMDATATFPSGISDAEFKKITDDLLLSGYEEGVSGLNAIGCISGTTKAIGDSQTGALQAHNPTSENPIFIGLNRMPNLPGIIALSVPTFDKNGIQTGTLNELLFNELRQSEYNHAFNRSMAKIASHYPGIMDNYPDLPTADGLPEFRNEFDYRAFVANFVLNDIPFKSTVVNPSYYTGLIPLSKFSMANGYFDFNGGRYTLFNPEKTVQVKVNPDQDVIDPYQNAYSSLTIDIQGQAYATEVSCSVDTTALNITGSNYGDWGGENRLTLPLNWGSQNMSGAITHTGNAELEENGTLLSADLFADMTTTTANVVCSAALSDASGNLIPVTVQNATITIDDGIHGGNGGFSGSIEIPVGVNPEDITVSVTINGRTITTGVDSAGNFSFDELRDGDFTIAFNADNYVQSCMNHSISEGANIDVGQITLFAGDINDDGEINIADFTYLAGKYGSANGDELYDQKADLNKDSVINVQDLAILASHFGSVQCNPQ
ncbi:dockerin type I domain-containing protein [Thalassolituus sp. UBA2009]|uniref:dockerin type I domain-containing protein n=1 Tax=Thalassolituus sp. UBA2009 TaxID=1947658 RepID=UPI00257F675D|nr:dockerin type I domain-containing protein [Thalassolituus sp. UBA2009]